MFSSIITKLIALPAAFKVGALAFLILMGVQVRHAVVIHRFNKQVAQLQIDLDHEKAQETGILMSINQQNAKIVQMQQDAEKAQLDATNRVLSRLTLGAKVSKELKSPQSTVPPGYPDMNLWLNHEFGVQ